ncbi:unnamed protein product [marine sediment metagenome]|uniref:Uncharacterized protein n=1 Tax=marine sediment metagenome TaxID=412755 RepID=X1SE28_9ZZZZ
MALVDKYSGNTISNIARRYAKVELKRDAGELARRNGRGWRAGG